MEMRICWILFLFFVSCYHNPFLPDTFGGVYRGEKEVTAVIQTPPAALTNQKNFSIQIGGADIVAYRYKLDDGTWSEEFPVNEEIGFANLSDAEYTLSVIGKDSLGNWQSETKATETIWVVDTSPPEFELISDTGGVTKKDSAQFRIQQTTENIVAYRYRLDSQPYIEAIVDTAGGFIQLTGLSDGEHEISVGVCDLAGNYTDLTEEKKIVWKIQAEIIWPSDLISSANEKETGTANKKNYFSWDEDFIYVAYQDTTTPRENLASGNKVLYLALNPGPDFNKGEHVLPKDKDFEGREVHCNAFGVKYYFILKIVSSSEVEVWKNSASDDGRWGKRERADDEVYVNISRLRNGECQYAIPRSIIGNPSGGIRYILYAKWLDPADIEKGKLYASSPPCDNSSEEIGEKYFNEFHEADLSQAP